MTVYTAKELANSLKIGGSTLRTWASYFNIPREKKGQKWIYYEDAKAIFETIKDLRDQDCGLNTIERKITVIPDEEVQELDSPETFQFQQKLVSQIHQNNQISEKFARVSFLAGKQQEKTRALEMKNEELYLEIQNQKSMINSLKSQLNQSVPKKEHSHLKFKFEELSLSNNQLEETLKDMHAKEQNKLKQLRILKKRIEQMQQIRIQFLKTDNIKEKIENLEPITLNQVNQILKTKKQSSNSIQLKILKPLKKIFLKGINIKGVSQLNG